MNPEFLSRIPMRLAPLALWASLCLPLTATAELWSPSEARLLADPDLTQPMVDELLALTPLLPEEALALRLRQIAEGTLPAPARDRILRDYAWQLRSFTPDAVAWSQLEWLATQQPLVQVAHPESRGTHGIPLFDIAAAAHGTMHAWMRESSLLQGRRALQHGDAGFFLALATAHPQQVAGAAEALRYGQRLDVAALAPELARQLSQSPTLTPMVWAAGQRLADPSLIEQVIRQGAAPWSTRALSDLHHQIAFDEAARIWTEVAHGDNIELAAIALVQMGGQADRIPGAMDQLTALLGDPQRGSAAAMALGPAAGPDQIHKLAELAADRSKPLLRRRATLALGRSELPQARTALRTLAEQADDPLAREVRQWLR